jgi:hypothetical protein
MKTETNKISLKEILNEKGLALLEEAIQKKQEQKGEIESLVKPKPQPTGLCPNCDPEFGYARIGNRCFCF